MRKIFSTTIIHISLIFLSLLFSISVYAQTDFSEVNIKTTNLSGNIYMLEGSGGNIGASIGTDGVLLIDTQYFELSEKIIAAISEAGGGTIRYVINTHFHRDHVSGNKEIGKNAIIIGHKNLKDRMSHETTVMDRINPPEPEEAWPVIMFEDSLTMYFNGEDVKLIHYPNSHSDTDVVVYFKESNVVHMGDLLFSYKFPYIDVSNGGNVQGLINSISKIVNNIDNNTKIIAGHGAVYSRLELTYYLTMLSGTVEIVREKMDAGYSLDQIKSKGLPEKWNSWGEGFINNDSWIEIIFKSLGGEVEEGN